jgi:hypothetical protein
LTLVIKIDRIRIELEVIRVEMRGRLTGSPEYDRAADYVIGKFKAYGLKPARAGGWLQPVSFVEQRVIAERSSAALVADGTPQPPGRFEAFMTAYVRALADAPELPHWLSTSPSAP